MNVANLPELQVRTQLYSYDSQPAIDSQSGNGSLTWDLRWLPVLHEGLGHEPYIIKATVNNQCVDVLPLAFVRSQLFGRFLVGLPYLNSGGVRSQEPEVRRIMIDHAAQLADALKVKHLELRHEQEIEHARFAHKLTSKIHMRLELPHRADRLWGSFKSKVRNQIRKSEQHAFEVVWGGHELLNEFYHVFSENMRDLGTPVFGKSLFRSIIKHFPHEAEFCVVRLASKPVAVAILMHGKTVTEVPSASCLRRFNSTNANMYMYWQLLQRAIDRGSQVFDFGRSSEGSGTYRFKKQWGAKPSPSVWQYYLREGDISAVRPDSPKYQLAIAGWKRLPVWMTRMIGPSIVRGIP